MYGYGSSGTIREMVIGLIVFFVVILICRELVCWYYKINKIVDLMHEQNKLLEKLIKNSIPSVFDHIVFQQVNLRSEPNLGSNILATLEAGERLLLLENGSDVTIDGINASWIRVKTGEEKIGWCFSGYIRKK